MPRAIFLMAWNPRQGPIIVGQYPSSVELDKDKLIDLFGLALRQGDAAHFSEIELRGEKVILYFTGMETRMNFGAIIEDGENLDSLRGAMVRAVADLIVRGIMPSSEDEWKDLFERIRVYQEMPLEEKVGELFSDSFLRRVYDSLLELGISRKDFVLQRLGILQGSREEDILRAYIEILNSLGIFNTYYDEESMREYLFLMRDVVILRRKPKLYELIAKKIDGYKQEYSSFVQEYLENKKWLEEQETLASIFASPRLYSALKELREKGLIKIEDIPEELKSAMDVLEAYDICRSVDDLCYLLTDVAIVLMFPKYSIHKCLEQYSSGVLALKEVEAYLNAVKKSYQ